MKTNVYYITKCRCCNKNQRWILRETETIDGDIQISTNISLTDEDVTSMITDMKEERFELKWCNKCDFETMQEFVGVDK